jgi:hypothetical protein
MEIILRWTVGDEEEGDANNMDENAQQDLETVQGYDGVADSLFMTEFGRLYGA